MSTEDRFDAAMDDVKGNAKEAWGKATDDKELEAEGKFDKLKSDVKEGVADVKDKAKDLMDKVTDKNHDR